VLEDMAQEDTVGLGAIRPQVDHAVDLQARAAVDRAIRALLDEAPGVAGARAPVLDRTVPVEVRDRLRYVTSSPYGNGAALPYRQRPTIVAVQSGVGLTARTPSTTA
jgi:hypothetical protein